MQRRPEDPSTRLVAGHPPPADAGGTRPPDLVSGDAAPRKPRRLLVTAAKISVSTALIAWILSGTSLDEVGTAMRRTDLGLLAGAFALNLVGWLISITRWRTLLAAQRVFASYGFLLKSYMVAIFFNNVLPSTIGGDTVRAYDSWRLGGRKADAATVVFVDRFMGMLALLLFGLVATLGLRWLPISLPLLPVWMALAAAGFLFVAWMLFMPPSALTERLSRLRIPLPTAVTGKLIRIGEALQVFRGNRGALGKALGLSLLLQTNVILHYYLIALALGLSIPVFAFFLIIPLTLAVMALPISINAIGIRENAFAFFFAMYGIATAEAVAFAWLAYALVLLQGLVGGVVYALRR